MRTRTSTGSTSRSSMRSDTPWRPTECRMRINKEGGRAMLRDAAAKLLAQTGPDAWVQTLFSLEAVSRTARELGDWTLAAEFAEQMRLHDSTYPGTAYALALIADQRRDSSTAR